MEEYKFAFIIPTYPPDFEICLNMIEQIIEQTEKPDEIIIACSECDDEKKKIFYKYNEKLEELKIKYKIINTIEKCYAGINRNRGVEVCESDYILFVDSDDIISPYKLEISKKMIKKYNCDVFINTYLMNHSKEYKFINYDIESMKIIDKNKLDRNMRKKYKERYINLDINKEKISKYHMNIFTGINYPHHGIICIKRDIFKNKQYTDMRRGEDSLFIIDVLRSGYNVIFSPMILINYLTNA
jgi:hypothetical protein